MFAGHFGLAAAVKSKQPQLPLWALMLSTQLLDILFVPLLLTNVETLQPVVGTKGGYGEVIIHADYTHSLVGALLIAICAGVIAWRLWSRNGGLVIGAVVFSHWLLDLLVHRADLPILPGNVGNLPRLGFGLWQFPYISSGLEFVLIVIGGALYFQSALARARSVDADQQQRSRTWAIIAGSVTCLLLVLSLVTNVLGIG
ncbi:metal-dependent hydrolase [Ktedonobacter robiniae]|uniref:Permease n=1 Tax=Ktedonobacter robiniae TaxID=2778365 RepID=A0ABQ3V6P7_9CHLR|nr:metal-dependent hydrolase [Ktedonobacter robiniae]GHO60628.1 permease [Ktedonobacter robiniae]